ncbi:hypothetical protein ABIE89_004920 [Bradyrhizobium niftali]|uniref:hypothetical protein n=1 Tax=Bradyrhizobium niftali TaxID=2560055 RepID=UPI003832B52D
MSSSSTKAFLAYVTGCLISENMYRACLLPRDGEPIMILRAVDLGPFTESSWLSRCVAFADWEDPDPGARRHHP